MHYFCSRKYSFCHQFLQKELLPNIYHLHLSARSVCLVLEFVREAVFLITFSIVEEISPRMELYSHRSSPAMCVVVVHSCKLQGHIKHEWEGYLGDVGLGRYPSTRHPTPS